MDILQDSITGDAVFFNGPANTIQAVVTQIQDRVAQRLTIKLRTFYGEWFLTSTYGVPYYQQIFGRRRKKSTIDLIFQSQILDDPDVVQLVSFSSRILPDRTYSFTFVARCADGTTTPTITINPGN